LLVAQASRLWATQARGLCHQEQGSLAQASVAQASVAQASVAQASRL